MSGALYSALAWLPPPPTDFGAKCRQALDEPGEVGLRLRALALHALDENQLNQLTRVIQRAQKAARSLAPLAPFRLAVLGNATTDFVVPVLAATALRHGFALECITAPYDQVAQQALSAQSPINASKPDAVLLAVDHRGYPLAVPPGDTVAAGEAVSRSVAHLRMIRAAIAAHSGAPCLVQTLARPAEQQFGNLDARVAGTPTQLIDALNRAIVDSIEGSADVLFDVAALAQTIGLADWHDPRLWNLGKLPFASQCLPIYAEHVCRLLAALRGKSRRCLILDLDNTLWGGVIGDDGLEGIVLGQGDATGEAHLSVQQAALALRERGVVLAVSSKNDDAIAREAFRKHTEMLVREEHIAVFQANWDDKATNIKAIASALNLGLESMLLLDDNPAERALVRRLLPEVAVPELPDDPGLYARTLLASGWFEAVTFSAEDRARAGFYRDSAKRVALQQQAGDLEAYLASLQMVLTVSPFDEPGRARITQLINKSNQYNLTTRRYTEAQVLQIERDPACFTLQARLADTFGDNGMISVVICRAHGDEWRLDTWLMSCRVLGRHVEQALLAELVAAARGRGIRRLVGEYLPTARNKLVEDHYARLGFEEVERQPDGTTRWQLQVTDVTAPALPMQVRRPERAA
jgi:FkbH-like protein